jgi:hypothetical protein
MELFFLLKVCALSDFQDTMEVTPGKYENAGCKLSTLFSNWKGYRETELL